MKISEVKKRGRPRSPETVARDAMVLGLIQESPRTRNELWRILGYGNVSFSQTYLSLARLREQGLIRACKPDKGDTLWTTEPSCP